MSKQASRRSVQAQRVGETDSISLNGVEQTTQILIWLKQHIQIYIPGAYQELRKIALEVSRRWL